MEVILLERVDKLGQMGDVVKVKSGYARNFLLPQKKALHANEENRKFFENQKVQLEAADLKLRGEAEKVAAKLEGLAVVLVRQAGEAGQLYGSVNARDIASEIIVKGFTVDKNQIRLDRPIKTLGVYALQVSLHPDVCSDISVNVARSADEAEIQARTGRAVLSNEDEEDAVASDESIKAADEISSDEASKIFDNPDDEIEKIADEASSGEEGAASDDTPSEA